MLPKIPKLWTSDPNPSARHLATSDKVEDRIAAAKALRAHEVLFLLTDPDIRVRAAAAERCVESPVMSALFASLGMDLWDTFLPQLNLDDPDAPRIVQEFIQEELYTRSASKNARCQQRSKKVRLMHLAVVKFTGLKRSAEELYQDFRAAVSPPSNPPPQAAAKAPDEDDDYAPTKFQGDY